MSLEEHTVGPATNHPHTHTFIVLHGRDSTAQEFASEFFESEISPSASDPTGSDRTLQALFPTVRWVFPQAGSLPAERFEGVEMSQWFDMWSLGSWWQPRRRWLGRERGWF
jgi:lysophospholipase-2